MLFCLICYYKGKNKEEGAHNYETLNDNNSFTPKPKNVYENPGAVINGEVEKGDDNSEHDYEMADTSVVTPNGAAYENPAVAGKDAESAF